MLQTLITETMESSFKVIHIFRDGGKFPFI